MNRNSAPPINDAGFSLTPVLLSTPNVLLCRLFLFPESFVPRADWLGSVYWWGSYLPRQLSSCSWRRLPACRVWCSRTGQAPQWVRHPSSLGNTGPGPPTAVLLALCRREVKIGDWNRRIDLPGQSAQAEFVRLEPWSKPVDTRRKTLLRRNTLINENPHISYWCEIFSAHLEATVETETIQASLLSCTTAYMW